MPFLKAFKKYSFYILERVLFLYQKRKIYIILSNFRKKAVFQRKCSVKYVSKHSLH